MKPRILVAAGAAAAAAIALVALSGLVRVESHRGFFAPAWSADGRSVWFLERRTRGITWGLGWEFFSPPAWARVLDDELSLRVLDVASGDARTVLAIAGSPLPGRTTRNYRGRIFNTLSAGIDATGPVLRFSARLSIPVVPRSETWHVAGTWPHDGAPPAWSREWAGHPSASEPVLRDGIELMISDGPESYPAAILAVHADGRHDVLLESEDFDALYPHGVPARWLAERSRREQIERVREFRRTHAELVERFRADGMSEHAASLAAYERMKQTGHLPKDPTVTAHVVDAPPPEEPVFEIPPEYFEVGLFRDIAAAIGAPGTAVATGTGDYLRYRDDDVGVRLREHRTRHDRFHVRSAGTLYRLDVQRPPAR